MTKIPDATIKRLSLYSKQLRILLEEGYDIILSKDLANRLGLNPTQVRKDLSYFGKFGRRKMGYDAKELLENIREILGISTDNKIGLFGVGNLGRALLGFPGFSSRGFYITAIFDNDPSKIGKSFHGRRCYPMEEAGAVVKAEEIKIAILAVPDDAADKVIEVIRDAGIKAVLNFTQRHLPVHEGVMVRSVDFTDKLELLSYFSHYESRTKQKNKKE